MSDNFLQWTRCNELYGLLALIPPIKVLYAVAIVHKTDPLVSDTIALLLNVVSGFIQPVPALATFIWAYLYQNPIRALQLFLPSEALPPSVTSLKYETVLQR